MIKRTLLITIFIFGLITLFSSCEKKTELLKTDDISDYKIPEDIVKNVEVKNGMLCFKDYAHVKKTINLLDEEYNNFTEKYFVQYKGLSEEELNLKVEEDNFRPEVVFEAFEKYFNLNSLRKLVANKQKEWLKNEKLNFDKDPANNYLNDEAQRTLFTAEGTIIIGNSIFVSKNSNVLYEITDGNFETVQKILNGDIKDLNIKTYNDCKKSLGTWQQNHNDRAEYNSSNKKMKCRVEIHNVPWYHYIEAETNSYYKKRKRWKKRYTSITNSVSGYVWDKDVYNTDQSYGNAYGANSSSSYAWKVKSKVDVGYWCKTQSNYVTSYHSVKNVNDKYLSLHWN